MTLNAMYVPMMDEADGFPKIFRLIKDSNGTVLASAPADYNEVIATAPDVLQSYFDLVSEFMKNMSVFMDNQSEFSKELYFKMIDLQNFVSYFFVNYTVDLTSDILGQ
jgi:hypothetical protein